ncbi:MAG TPA: flagellar biosynthetic protein FliO [Pirellulaceae bacterium]|nr:flagellar biosynthetic protein FliO [Pirellulaceae bacterium]
MSARVCFIIACASLVLAAHVNGQAQRDVAVDQSRRVIPSNGEILDAETGDVASQDWSSRASPSGEHISNAPRSVSYVDDIPNGASQTSPSRHSSAAASDDSAKHAPMPLPPRSKRKSRQPTTRAGSTSGRALLTVLSSLAIVLAVFFAFVWLTRSAAPKGMAPLSKDVVESLGRAPLLGRQQMQLIRIGNKLILLSVTSTGADTLTEITDPAEVDRLSGLCRQSQSGSISDTFRQVLAQASSEPATSPRGGQRQSRRSGTLESHRA